jgi:hypothetical protein
LRLVLEQKGQLHPCLSALSSWLAFLLIVYAINFFSSPPPSGEAVAGAALAMWLLVAWGYWVDHNRQPVTD